MADSTDTTRVCFWLWLIRFIGLIVPQRLRADWRQEWEAELRHRETMLAEWDKLDWRSKLDLWRRSLGALWDALLLQPERWEDELIQDLRFGVRMLLKHKGFTFVAVLTLALGIGANTAIFSVVQAVLLRPLPYPEPERLVFVFETEPELVKAPVSGPDFLDWQEANQVFETLVAGTEDSANLTEAGLPQRVNVIPVSAGFFETLGVMPMLGRPFQAQDDQPGQAPVAMLTHALWQARFGADPFIIGKQITLNGQKLDVIGVMPAQFVFPPIWGLTPDLFIPLALQRDEQTRGSHWLWVMARLKAGVSPQQAQTAMADIAARLATQYPQSNRDIGAKVIPMQEHLVGDTKSALLILFGAVAFVLLIASTNLANLFLSRLFSRQRELALRAALGASRFRLLRQLLTESLLLSLGGGMIGLLLASWTIKALLTLTPAAYLPQTGQVEINLIVFLFTLGLSLLTGVLSALIPAWQAASVNLNESLKEGAGHLINSVRGRSLRSLLVVAEVALGLVLVIGAGLMVRSVQKLLAVDPGFVPANVLSLHLELPELRYRKSDQVRQFYENLVQRVQALPGVTMAGATSHLPLGGGWNGVIQVEGRPRVTGMGGPLVHWKSVLSEYFRALGIPLLRGRTFNPSDAANSVKVVVINQTLARQFWPNEDPLGKRLSYGNSDKPDWHEVVGVVGDVHQWGLTRSPMPEIYFAYAQRPLPSMHLLAQSVATPDALAQAIRQQVQELDKELPLDKPIRLESILREATYDYRFQTWLMSIFGALALLLVSVGVYGVMSYTVAQHTHEFGIRLALGAQPRDLLRMVIGQAMTLTLTGIALGLPASFGLTRWLKTLLFGVSVTDPWTFAGVALLLLLVSLLACFLPARRATKVDPLVALRRE